MYGVVYCPDCQLECNVNDTPDSDRFGILLQAGGLWKALVEGGCVHYPPRPFFLTEPEAVSFWTDVTSPRERVTPSPLL